jgi:hypothetical protein
VVLWYYKKGGGFALMQNIERFQDAAKAYGVPVTEVFQTVDLWERKNIPQVTQCIFALGRTVRGNTTRFIIKFTTSISKILKYNNYII